MEIPNSVCLWMSGSCFLSDHIHASHLPGQATEDVLDVGVIASRLWNGDAQLGIAERTNGSDDTSNDPHNQSQAHRAGVLQNPLGTHEDP